MAELSVVTLMRGKTSLTHQMMRTLKASTACEYDLVIVENPSDDPYTELPDHPARVITRETANINESINIGINSTDTPYVVCVNNDILVGYRAMDNLLAAMKADSELWCVSPQVSDWVPPPNWDLLAKEVSEKPQEYAEGGILGCCFMLSRVAWETVGGYDENFDLWFSEYDYGNRLSQLGHPAKRITNAIVHHFIHSTAGTLPDSSDRNERSLAYYKKKWGG